MPVMTKNNLDLWKRRKELHLRQSDIARELGCAISAVSDFETGERDTLPHGKGRAEYEAVLAKFERKPRRTK